MKCPFTPVEMAHYRRTGLLRPTCPCPFDPECDCSYAGIFEDQDAGIFVEQDGDE